MELNEYQRQAMHTKKKFNTEQDQVMNGLLGLAGETGEVCDLVKKFYRGDGPLDMEKLKKELGDVMWYIAELCDIYNFSMEEVAQANIAKLTARHGGEKYSGVGNRVGAGE